MLTLQISRQLGIRHEQVISIIHSANYCYKHYTIDKRDGSKRNISQPSKRLKILQRWVSHQIFGKLPIHSQAKAYIKGCSIRDNAIVHAKSRFIQKMDFKNFFESISSRDISVLLLAHKEELNISSRDISDIISIVCLNRYLTIGAPSSPIISNAILYDFDCRVSEYCEKHKFKYTRYADDLTFSSDEQDKLHLAVDFVRALIKKIDNPTLTINERKVVSISKKHRRTVTGLTLTSDGRVSIGRVRKREIKALVHQYIEGKLPPEKVDYLKGWVAYMNSADPAGLESLMKKYGGDKILKLMSSKP